MWVEHTQLPPVYDEHDVCKPTLGFLCWPTVHYTNLQDSVTMHNYALLFRAFTFASFREYLVRAFAHV